ncbi:MAG: S1C family serine protease, partial [Anaerolineales bacterium]
VERVAQTLVTVNGRQRQSASGLVYQADIVLTANHALEREDALTVQTPDGRTLPAELIGRDLPADLAVLRVVNLGLAAAVITPEPARVGQWVLAVGRPSPEGPMASLGVVSAVGGPLKTSRGILLERYIQTDATPYPGFSGGSLIDPQGAALGVLTSGLVNGVALAVPAPLAWRTAAALVKHGSVKRGYLGVSSQVVELPTQERNALLIMQVQPDSPAARSGLLLGDILLSLGSIPLHAAEDLLAGLNGGQVGQTIAVEILRGGIPRTLHVTIGERS